MNGNAPHYDVMNLTHGQTLCKHGHGTLHYVVRKRVGHLKRTEKNIRKSVA